MINHFHLVSRAVYFVNSLPRRIKKENNLLYYEAQIYKCARGQVAVLAKNSMLQNNLGFIFLLRFQNEHQRVKCEWRREAAMFWRSSCSAQAVPACTEGKRFGSYKK